MKRFKILLTAAILVAAGTLSAQSVEDLTAKLTSAAQAANAKNFVEAIPLFEGVIAEGADVEGAEQLVAQAKQFLPISIFRLGGSQFMAGKLDDAMASFTKAAEVAEIYGNVGVLNNARTWIGQTALKQGEEAFNSKNYAAAAAIFQKGYEGNPNDMNLALNLAMSYSGMNEYDKSGEIYRAIIARDGDSRFADAVAKARTNLITDNLVKASEAAKAKDFAGAAAAAEEVMAIEPTHADAQMLRVQAFNNMKNWARVIAAGDAAAEAQATDAARSNVNYLVAVAYQNSENYPKAAEYYKKVSAGDYAATAKIQITELQKVLK